GERMAKTFIEVGKRLGITTEVVLTDGTQPSGQTFGPALEAKEALEILEGKTFNSLAQKACELSGVLLELTGKVPKGKGTLTALDILRSGKALKKFQEIIKAQGPKILHSKDVPRAPFIKKVTVPRDGEVSSFNLKKLIEVARISGAPGDQLAGIILRVDIGDKVKKGDLLFEIHGENKRKLDLAFSACFDDHIVELERIILEKIE
ncbi:MAG: thymidine phosphorylase, partial [Candidatus Diapherotrites archaeon]|nr:thymidine phosphorylase [Candidatus Diapherotrites archaeon]